MAAENANRRWICIERDEDYAAKAINRISAHVGLNVIQFLNQGQSLPKCGTPCYGSPSPYRLGEPMFDGRDYQQSFQDALNKLTSEGVDRDVVLGQLVGIEFTLWEAIRGAMILTGNIAGLVFIAPISYLAWQTGNGAWVIGAICVVAWLLIMFALYWLFKFAVYYEIGRHIKERRFGDLDLPWLPGGTGYREEANANH